MKKIISAIFLMGLTGLLTAQEAPTKQLSISEANRLNGTPKEPTINGKPYSQYKAEQEALKQQRAVKTKQTLAANPTGLTIMPVTGTAPDPAAERMKEPVQYGVKVVDEKGAAEPGKAVDAAIVKTEVKQPATTPEVPVHFRLPENRTWGTAAAEVPVKNTGTATQLQSDPAQPVNAPVRGEAYKTPVMKDVNNGGDKKDLSPAVQTIPASVVDKKQQDAAKPAPEVPAQFRMPENAGWGTAATTEKPVRNNVAPPQIKSDAAQSMNTPVSAEMYKTPEMKDANMNNNKKDINPAEAKATIPAAVVSSKQPAAATPAPEVPSQFRLPATQSWNGRPVATEASASSLVTEKAASRTAADAPKSPEVSADKVQKPAAEKNTTPIPAAAGAGNGETSKVSVPGVIYPQQEAPKKD